MDIIFLSNLKFDAIIGIYEWERLNKQTVILDIELAVDIRPAAESDDIEYALDYKAVHDRIKALVENSRFFLVESLISEIALLIQKEFSVPWLKIKLNKKGVLGPNTDVGIVIERGSKPL